MSLEFLWYIPNTVEAGHRGDDETNQWTSLDLSAELARSAEEHGWGGALIGTGWGRPDTFTLATSLAARTTRFKPLIAIRPGYWQPAHFASAAATLDQLSQGRVLVNIVSGQDNLAAYGDAEGDQAERYARTREFMQIVRRLWTEEGVTFRGRYFAVEGSTVSPRPYGPRTAAPAPLLRRRLGRGRAGLRPPKPTCSSSGVSRWTASPSGSTGSRRWPSPSAGRSRRWSSGCGSPRWSATRPRKPGATPRRRWPRWRRSSREEPQRRPSAPGRRPGRASSIWRSGARCSTPACSPLPASSAPAARGRPGWSAATTRWPRRSRKYQDLGITHFVLSDTPYLHEVVRVGDQLLSRLRQPVTA